MVKTWRLMVYKDENLIFLRRPDQCHSDAFLKFEGGNRFFAFKEYLSSQHLLIEQLAHVGKLLCQVFTYIVVEGFNVRKKIG